MAKKNKQKPPQDPKRSQEEDKRQVERKEEEVEDEEEEEDEKSFEDLGLDHRLLRALIKKGVGKPFPIQRVAIPLILVSLYHVQIVA